MTGQNTHSSGSSRPIDFYFNIILLTGQNALRLGQLGVGIEVKNSHRNVGWVRTVLSTVCINICVSLTFYKQVCVYVFVCLHMYIIMPFDMVQEIVII
jgi:hypothetical protein